jgi:hypothetical protein
MSSAAAASGSSGGASAAQLEHPLLRTPYETLERITRNVQKIVTKELQTANATTKALAAKAKGAKPAQLNALKESANKTLTAMLTTMTGLKRKVPCRTAACPHSAGSMAALSPFHLPASLGSTAELALIPCARV